MKLSHSDSDLVLEVADDQADVYASQGWRPVVEPPAGNASLEAWQEYAREQGLAHEDIQGRSRDDLRSALS